MARLTQDQWRALINEQAASGQTATAFCAERGIDNKYFCTRKKQLAESPSANRFVAVKRASAENESIQIFAGATHMRIPVSVSAQRLAELFKALA